MSKDSHKIVATWEKIAEYTPFSEQVLRKRFGPEMKRLKVVHIDGMPGRKKKGPIRWGVVWEIEKYFREKADKGELGIYKPTNPRKTKKERNSDA